MYFWNIKKLKKDLASNLVSERQGFIYFLLITFFMYFFYEVLFWLPSEPHQLTYNFWAIINSILNVTAPTLGVVLAYLSNSGNAGKNFLLRYFTISWVLSFRFLAGFLLLLLVYMALMVFIFPEKEELLFENIGINTLLNLVLYFSFYWRLSVHIKDVARSSSLQ